MAKATFHKNQRVWVETVGTWAVVEKIVPIWAQGFDEPVRITYDLGLGRAFQAHEMSAEEKEDAPPTSEGDGEWRLMRARNKWQPPEDCSHHPHPGTFPVVVTDQADWGGWRVPGAEYDRDPARIERQALVIVGAPRMARLLSELVQAVADAPDSASAEILQLAHRADRLLRAVENRPKVGAPTRDVQAAA